jgi:hypothetical protein
VVVPANSSAIFMIVSWHPLIRIQSYFKDTKYALPILIIKGHSFSWHSEILLPHVRRILIYTVLVHQEGLRVLKFILDIRDRTRYSLRLFWSDWPSFVAHPQQFFLRWWALLTDNWCT